MPVLSALKPDKIIRAPKIIIYGQPGIGKTTFANRNGKNNQTVLAFDLNDGFDGMDVTRYPVRESEPSSSKYLFKTFFEVHNAIVDVYKQEHAFDTLIIDGIDDLERLIHTQVCKERNVKTLKDIPYGGGPDAAMPYWNQILEGLEALRNHKGMTIILLSHAQIKRFDNPLTDSYDCYNLAIETKKAAPKLIGWADCVLFACEKVLTSKMDVGFGKSKHRATASAGRVLRTIEKPSHVAKNRYGMPYEIPLEWEAFYNILVTSATANGAQDEPPAVVLNSGVSGQGPDEATEDKMPWNKS